MKRAIERAKRTLDWHDAGAGWQVKEGDLRLQGWSRQRRIVMLRRRTERSLGLVERDAKGQLALGFAEIDAGREVLGICSSGDLAELRDPEHRPALS